MKSEYAFKKTLNNFKTSFNGITDADLIINEKEEQGFVQDTHIYAQILSTNSSNYTKAHAIGIEQQSINDNGAIEQTRSDVNDESKAAFVIIDEQQQLMQMMHHKQQSHLLQIDNKESTSILTLNFVGKRHVNSTLNVIVTFDKSSLNDIDDDKINNIKFFWSPKQLQFNQSELESMNDEMNKMNYSCALSFDMYRNYDLSELKSRNFVYVLCDLAYHGILKSRTAIINSKQLSKMVQIDFINHNNKLYQINDKVNAIDNNMDKNINHKDKVNEKHILNATETFCDNYKIDLNIAKSDKNSSKNLNTTINFTPLMEIDKIFIANKTKSLTANYNENYSKMNNIIKKSIELDRMKNNEQKSKNIMTVNERKEKELQLPVISSIYLRDMKILGKQFNQELYFPNIRILKFVQIYSNTQNIVQSEQNEKFLEKIQKIHPNNGIIDKCIDVNDKSIISSSKIITTSTSYISFDELIELIDSEPKRIRQWEKHNDQFKGKKPLLSRLLRLCGGGEQAINNGTTGWGSPPSATNSAAVVGSAATGNTWGSASQALSQQWGTSSPQQSSQSQAQHTPTQQSHHQEALHQQITQQQQTTRQPVDSSSNAASLAVGRISQAGQSQSSSSSSSQSQPSQVAGGNTEVAGGEQAAGMIGNSSTNIATKNQLEQLTTLREALFSQDGWGCQHVNQDTNWDVPGSPEPVVAGNIVKPDPNQAVPTATGGSVAAPWKPNINNGTELWEANLRNGGQPPAQAVQKPWGHTPSTNLGGTWGEDDDGLDTANVWTSNSSVNVNTANANVGQNATMWPQTAGANTANTPANTGGPSVSNIPADIKRDNEWTSNNAGANSWANSMQSTSRDVRNVAGNQMDIRNPDPRDVRLSNASHFNIPMGGHPSRELLREISTRGDVRGDLRGISGRLNGTSEMWGHHNLSQSQGNQGQPTSQNPQTQQSQQQTQNQQQQQQQQQQHGQMPMNKITEFVLPQQQNAQINNQQKDLSQPKPTGWEEPSPPTQRRNIPNYDDGTSLWGQQQQASQQQANQQQSGQQQQPVSLPQNRVNRLQVGNNWDDKNVAMGGNTSGNASVAWDTQTQGVWQQQQKTKSLMGAGADDLNEWNHGIKQQQQNKMAAIDIIRNSKQYRMLFDMGFKKEEIEMTLRATNLNLEDAIEILNQSRPSNNMDAWRRHDEHNTGAGTFEHNNFPQRYPTGPQIPFPPNNNPNLLNNIGVSGGNSNPCLNTIGNMQPMQQKFINQGAHNASGTGFNQGLSGINQSLNAGNSGNSTPAGGQPSAQQLRMLVQQIQMAVQAGYLNHQILNQPLAPTTLVLLNQLLTHIKQLQVNQANLNRGINNIHITLNISKLKQQIASLQNQIAQQQAAYVNKQPSGNHGMSGNDFVPVKNPNAPGIGITNIGNVNTVVGPSTNDFLRGQHDPISSLQGTFSEMSMTKETPNNFQNTSSQQSRLNQWKLPNYDKDNTDSSTDFSRAPGTTSKSTMSTSNSVIGSLGLQNDGTWSSGRSEGWPDSTPDSENKDWPSSQQSPATAFTDLVPEFEPGKPWKGSQLKTIEDDPSITPGSVARSPLSIAAKEADLFAASSKTSPTDLPPLSLSSSTWSFNPSGSSQPQFTSSSKGSWSDGVSHQIGNELWSAPMTNKSRGPPPGLGNNNKSNLSTVNATTPSNSSGTNGWIGSNLSNRVGGTNNWSSGSWPSTWLLLKNMTAQIDGSTLRTLCMQHGPLQHFHLYLNHGIALCKYATREEANKAQMALNNCVLGNTTICAESPCDNEVQNILQHLGVPSQQQPPQAQNQQSQQQPSQPGQQTTAASNTSQWRPSSQNTTQFSTKPTGSDTWGANSVWPTPNTTPSFWTGLDASSNERGTPSSLNSLLPENLLGNELN